MKQINLLPIAVRQRAAQQQVIPLIALAVVAGIAAVGIVWAVVNTERTTIKDNLAAVQAADEARTAQEKKDHPEPAVDSDLTQRVAQLNALAKSEVNWSRALSFIGGLVPKDVVLSNYSLAGVQSAPVLKLAGVAPSSVSFATFAEALRTNKAVTSFKVDGFTYNAASGGSITFSVTISLPINQLDYSQK
jgi:Tfp pilus assembly protein PilN